MPADSIPAAHPALTEVAAHPVSKSSLKRDYTIPYPSERDFMLARSRHNSTGARNVRDGSWLCKKSGAWKIDRTNLSLDHN
jgi:hypothetical protein